MTNSEEANSAHAYNEIQGIFSQLKVRADYVDLSWRSFLPMMLMKRWFWRPRIMTSWERVHQI